MSLATLSSLTWPGPTYVTTLFSSHVKMVLELMINPIQLPRKSGGLGPDLKLSLLADKSHKIASDYGVLLEEGVSLRGLFLIDPNGTLRQIT